MSLMQAVPSSSGKPPAQFSVNRVRISYVSALLIVVILCALNYVVVNKATDAQQVGASLIDTSGRQRMLSQRIALLGSLVVNAQGNDRTELRRNLLDTIDEMRLAHDFLMQSLQPLDIQALPVSLDALLNGYWSTAEQVAETASPDELWRLVTTAPVLLNRLDAMSQHFTVFIQEETNRFKAIELLMFVASVVVMFLVGVGIFLPMERRIRADQTDLLTEVDERKRVENVLQESQQFVFQILNMTPDLVYTFDLDERRNTFSNRDFATVLGYTGQEFKTLYGDSIENIMHPEDFKRVTARTQEFLEANSDDVPLENEYRLKAADNVWHWFYIREMIFARHPDGTPSHA